MNEMAQHIMFVTVEFLNTLVITRCDAVNFKMGITAVGRHKLMYTAQYTYIHTHSIQLNKMLTSEVH